MNKYRWGILATGHIASKMAQALHEVEDAEIVAVGSRSHESANTFGEQWNIPRRYSSYQALVEDAEIDVVYIATPHNLHAEAINLSLRAGKHVLCEKPLTLNAHESAECIALAREKKRFLMEAIWTRFIPAIVKLREWIAAGKIGQLRLIQADFCIQKSFDPAHRLFNPKFGGGALLDLGIYPLSLTTMLLGYPDEIQSRAFLGKTGVDEFIAMTLTYGQEALAVLTSGLRIERPSEAMIVGTEGYVRIHENFFHPDQLTLHLHGSEPKIFTIPYQGNGYPHEVLEVHRCLDQGLQESEEMSLGETQRMMELMDSLRLEWGVKYPCE